ncbi:hypothetical protein [Listeria seeligeri]|uniref:hypothetical protein n=1 Tax=Listeria seeligeri TaxID=1640 RepID=UPI0022EC0431|nr:hypothetical protein [Listeria seeligeri]
MCGRQLNEAELLAYKISDELKENLGERISSSFSFSRIQETPWIEFSIEFVTYNFFNIILNYNRGSFGCAIVNGDLAISLPNSQEWYDKADMNVFLQRITSTVRIKDSR